MAAPGYKIPSVETMRGTHIDRRVSSLRTALDGKLEKSKVVTIIIDLWSSKSMLGFMGTSVAGVTHDYEPFMCLLSIKNLTGSHTGRAILAEYEEIVQEWKLSSKVILFYSVHLFYFIKTFFLFNPGAARHYR